MRDRRHTTRDEILYVAKADETGAVKDCVAGTISENGAHIEFSNVVNFPREQMSPTVARESRSFLAKVISWRDHFVGVAFSDAAPAPPESDLDERLRKSQAKKHQLQQRIEQLLGED